MSVDTLLLEIGSEELPPKLLQSLMDDFAASMADGLTQAGFTFESITGLATPRRLAVLVKEFNADLPDQQVERRGPALAAAWDEAGKPTQALLGFAKSCGVEDLATLERQKTDKGEWVVFRQTVPARPADELIGETLIAALSSLPAPRKMRWGKHREEALRPIKWLCALHGKRTIPFSIFGLESSNTSHGHRFMSSGRFKVDQADAYIESCRQHFVMVDFAERQEKIRSQVIDAAKAAQGQAEMDEDLLREVTALVEWPVALTGKFDPAFLDVPEEALISAMKEHQRYFHLTDKAGKLTNQFITLANLKSQDPSLVIKGNERVIHPRLADAAFFYQQDSARPLNSKIDQLDQVVFQKDLGSYGDKTHRVTELCAYIAEALAKDERFAQEPGLDETLARRAAQLCKVDLMTDMVGEFPDLQGIMGGYYAASDGEDETVCQAIREHYLPSQAGGSLPATPLGQCLALADKLDTLTGLIGAGQLPSGSRDPFALRRQSLGVIRICIEGNLDLDMLDCLKRSSQLHEEVNKGAENKQSSSSKSDHDQTVNLVHDYLCERLANWYGEQQIGGDLIKAVRASMAGARNLKATHEAVTTLHAFRREPVAQQVISANKRVANILKQAAGVKLTGKVNQKLLTEAAEIDLHKAVIADDGIAAIRDIKEVKSQLDFLAGMQPRINLFFDEVLVMAEDERVKKNRLQLLFSLRQLFLAVADFSLLQQDDAEA